MGAAGFQIDGGTLTVRQMLVPVGAAGPARLPAESEVSEGDKVVEARPPSAFRWSRCPTNRVPVMHSVPPWVKAVRRFAADAFCFPVFHVW